MTASAPLTVESTGAPGARATRGGEGLRAGIGLRAVHHDEIVARRPNVGWFEAHTENYFARGGSQRRALEKVREHYELSLHGVGLSMGSSDPLDAGHLAQIARLVREYQPMLISEHLSWGSAGGRFTNDLLPMPYTEEALRHMIARVRQVQDALGRQILIENVSSYLEFKGAELTEWDFLAALAGESGCGLLLDVNNVYVSSVNHGFDPFGYISALPPASIRQVHLAGHSRQGSRLIDTHDSPVCAEVWALYEWTIAQVGFVPTMIERDDDIPALAELLAELDIAREVSARALAEGGAHALVA